MTTRHGDPACGTRHCYACSREQADGRRRRWVDAGDWFAGHDPHAQDDDDPTAFTLALEAALAEVAP